MAPHQLTAGEIAELADAPNTEGHDDGLYYVDRNLYVQIRGNSASWVLRARQGGRTRFMGLGPVRGPRRLTLREAQRQVVKCMRLIHDGFNPIEVRRAERAAAAKGLQPHLNPALLTHAPEPRAAESKPTLFRDVASDYLAGREAHFKDVGTADQWRQQFRDYVHPVIGDMAVDQITIAHIIEVLTPIWRDKIPTARKVRQRIEAVLDYAAIAELRSGPNPAAWSKRGALAVKLGGAPRHTVAHFAAMSYEALPAFWTEKLAAAEGVPAAALRFLVLTATRSAEVRGATWTEIDLEQRLWVIPAARMKMGAPHRVPLSDAAVALLEAIPGERTGLVFASNITGRPIARASLMGVLRRLGADATAHGFRSAFADWARDVAKADREVRELSLAHRERNEAVAAYSRSDLLERRRPLMEAWARFVTGAN